jgi:hypothetical protein
MLALITKLARLVLVGMALATFSLVMRANVNAPSSGPSGSCGYGKSLLWVVRAAIHTGIIINP